MTSHWVQHRNRIFVKGYRFLNIDKNISKVLSNKYSQKLFDWLLGIESAKDAAKTTSKRAM